MSRGESDDAVSEAVEQLTSLELTTYAARTLVALVALEQGTAQDVSEVSDVPRTRVYDAVEELRERGLVDVRQSSPKRFWPVSTETARRRFDREYERRMDVLIEALETRQSASRAEEQRGVWTVTGRDVVTDRVLEFVESATDEVIYGTVDELHTEELTDALGAADARGVTVRVAGLSWSVEEGPREAVPGAEPFESRRAWSEAPAGRLLLVDGERTLASVLEADRDGDPLPRDEIAIWGSGPSNALVVVLRTMFAGRLDPDERS
jgi:sugar-specific transcriptional regulator TrmB